MSKRNEYKPEYLVSPGEVIDEYVNNWDVEPLSNIGRARLLGLSSDELKSIILGSQPITPEIAAKLEPLGKPAAYWLELERKYQEDREALSGISRWRKVEDAPPPKDGKAFLAKDESSVCKCESGDWWISRYVTWEGQTAHPIWLGSDGEYCRYNYPFTHWHPVSA